MIRLGHFTPAIGGSARCQIFPYTGIRMDESGWGSWVCALGGIPAWLLAQSGFEAVDVLHLKRRPPHSFAGFLVARSTHDVMNGRYESMKQTYISTSFHLARRHRMGITLYKDNCSIAACINDVTLRAQTSIRSLVTGTGSKPPR